MCGKPSWIVRIVIIVRIVRPTGKESRKRRPIAEILPSEAGTGADDGAELRGLNACSSSEAGPKGALNAIARLPVASFGELGAISSPSVACQESSTAIASSPVAFSATQTTMNDTGMTLKALEHEASTAHNTIQAKKGRTGASFYEARRLTGPDRPTYFRFFALASRPKYFSQARAKGLATKIEE